MQFSRTYLKSELLYEQNLDFFMKKITKQKMLRNAETEDSEDHFSSKTLHACRLVRIMTHNNTECDRTHDSLCHCTQSYY